MNDYDLKHALVKEWMINSFWNPKSVDCVETRVGIIINLLLLTIYNNLCVHLINSILVIWIHWSVDISWDSKEITVSNFFSGWLVSISHGIKVLISLGHLLIMFVVRMSWVLFCLFLLLVLILVVIMLMVLVLLWLLLMIMVRMWLAGCWAALQESIGSKQEMLHDLRISWYSHR